MEKCMWCDKPATRYCDAVIGMEPRGALRDSKGNVTGLLGGLDGAQFTCDAPMCSDHARQVGWVCGAEPDSIDHCPHHTEHGEAPMRDLLMFEGEAEVKRRDVHAEIRRSLMRIERSNAELTGGPDAAKEGDEA